MEKYPLIDKKSNSIIRARAPLRLGFAGGGTDVSPFSDIYGGAVLNATIDRYAYATIQNLNNGVVEFYAQDKNIIESYNEKNLETLNPQLKLHYEIYKYFILKFNDGRFKPLRLSTFCDAPPGSGLGSSSTLVVSIIKAFNNLFNVTANDYEIAELAYYLERVKCNLEGGRQDQYSSVFGGFNFMEFNKNSSLITPLRLAPQTICELEASLILVFTGLSRESAEIIHDQSKNALTADSVEAEAMRKIKVEAYHMRDAILKSDYQAFVDSIHSGWNNKKLTSRLVTNPKIETVYNTALQNGALAGKVSGAGGGGFMWFYIPSEKRISIISALTSLGCNVSNCHFVERGAQSWRV